MNMKNYEFDLKNFLRVVNINKVNIVKRIYKIILDYD